MAQKNNIRSIRFSDELAELIEGQQGQNFTEKFENLVTRCVWEVPAREKELAELERRIRKSLFNISACADWRDRFFVLQGKKPQQSISCNDPIEGSCTIILHRRSMRLLQNPDGLQGFLTQSGRKICRQGGRGEMLNRL